ncbi:dihydrofolate reductase family protein [Microbispora corallina]|uniref:Deaminase n=1 Tax=Microbispora corallina TaxID=83302 RepID=A0ABQ4G4A0_9ACTN|nr:dihydrofolate reductase family protein [Microbispora corallina]GIH41897.1 deaminase [Microbispora corallina]
MTDGIVLWHVTMSLDGFITGPGDAMDWISGHSGPNPEVDEVLTTTGAVLAGRRSHDVGAGRGHRLYGGAWEGPVFVLTHRPANPYPGVTFLTCGVREAVETALAAAGGGNVVLVGADLARQCLAEGLVGEILVHVAPVLLGDGVRLHEAAGTRRVTLDTAGVNRAGGVANLRYRVRREVPAGRDHPWAQ